MSHITPDLIKAFHSGKSLIVNEAGQIQIATWSNRLVRLIPATALAQDQRLAQLFIAELLNSNCEKLTLDAAEKFYKNCKRTQGIFEKLDNLIVAHKCSKKLSIAFKKLVLGGEVSPVVTILKNNHLHHIIPKADSLNKETALLIASDRVLIRTKEGMSFLDRAEHIQWILINLPKDHPDQKPLSALRDLLLKKIDPNDPQCLALKKQLQHSNYSYIPLDRVPQNEKGVFQEHSYLANGIQKHHPHQWINVQPNFIETDNSRKYKLRVVTRLPEYALKTTWLAFLKSFFTSLFTFSTHGHSWVELVAPLEGSNRSNVISVGYYFHPFKRFQNSDPMSFMPIPDELKQVEEFDITEEQYLTGKLYLNEVQELITKPNRKLSEQPGDYLFKTDSRKVQYLYKSTIKSTCLAFANAFREVVTGSQIDDRGSVRRWFFPKKSFKFWDRIDSFVDKTHVLKRIVLLFSFVQRMEFPYWVRRRKPSK